MSNAAVSDVAVDEAAEKPRPGGSGKVLVILGLVNTVGVMAAIALAVVMGTRAQHAAPPAGEHAAGTGPAVGADGARREGGDKSRAEAPAEVASSLPPTAPPPNVPIGEFVVRLSSPEGERYARFVFEAQVRGQPEADVLKQQLPEVRDRFIGVLTDLTVDAVRSRAELDALKARLAKEVREVLPGGAVRTVFLTEFVLQ
ncbi:MAG: flagellar basal body-associated FliL family protein [Deltaproteobacteria bacterium]|nr:flagellar basal body-associated FliL family protein [Deltaproteobacteria bacterium]